MCRSRCAIGLFGVLEGAVVIGVALATSTTIECRGGEEQTKRSGQEATVAQEDKHASKTFSTPPAAKEESIAPLVMADGELGRVAVWLSERGVARTTKDVAPGAAQQLVATLEKAISSARVKAAPSRSEWTFPSRNDVLASGWVIELRYELPVAQTKLGFVSPDYSRLFALNRFLIPLTGKYAQMEVAAQPHRRLFPYEAIRLLNGPSVLRDWSADNQSMVVSTVGLENVYNALIQLGFRVSQGNRGTEERKGDRQE